MMEKQADTMEEVWKCLREGQNDCTLGREVRHVQSEPIIHIAQEDIPSKLEAGECHKRNQEIRRHLAKSRA